VIRRSTLVSEVSAPPSAIADHREMLRRRNALAVAIVRKERSRRRTGEECTHCWRRESAGADRAAPAGREFSSQFLCTTRSPLPSLSLPFLLLSLSFSHSPRLPFAFSLSPVSFPLALSSFVSLSSCLTAILPTHQW